MTGFTLEYTVKNLFFDRLAVQDKIDAAESRELSRIGAFIRRRARSLLRRRKKPSQPGQAPSVHSRDSRATLKHILFAYEPRRHTVVTGPTRLPSTDGHVPGLLEFGGRTTIIESRYTDRPMPWHPGRWRQGKVAHRKRGIKIKARPFMGPALDAEVKAGTIRDVWVGSLAA